MHTASSRPTHGLINLSCALGLVVALVGCTKRPLGQDGSAPSVHTQIPVDASLVDAPQDAAVAPQTAQLECFDKGPMHCNVPATNDDAGICNALAECAKQMPTRDWTDQLHTLSGCEEVARETISTDAGVDTVAFVSLTGDIESEGGGQYTNGTAAYLVTIRDGRACPAVELLPFVAHRRGYPETAFAMRANAQLGRIYTAAQRMEHMSLDQEELAANVSDISYQSCDRHVHLVKDGVLHELRHNDTSGPAACELAGAPRYIERGNETPTTKRSTPPVQGSCAGTGPLSCDVAESSTTEALCEQIRKCVEARGRSEEWYLSEVAECSKPLQTTKVTGVTDIEAMAVVEVRGLLGKKRAHSAYLVAQKAGGYCLVDQVFDPIAAKTAGTYRYELTWDEAKKTAYVNTERSVRLVLTKRGAPAHATATDVTDATHFRVQNGTFTSLGTSRALWIEP